MRQSSRTHAPIPASIVALGVDAKTLAVLRAIADGVALHDISDAADAARVLEALTDVCLVFPIAAAEEVETLPRLLQLRNQFIDVPAIVLRDTSRALNDEMLRLCEVGSSQIVNADPFVLNDLLRIALERAHADGIAIRLWRQCALELPERIIPVFKAALRLGHAPLTVDRLASAAGMHERTLRKYCTRRRLPSPQWIIGWARLLVAAHYLDNPGQTVEEIAEMLAFPSASALRNQLRRYTGLSTGRLRAERPMQTLARRLEYAVTHKMGASTSSPP